MNDDLEGAIDKFTFKRKINEKTYKLCFNNELRLLKTENTYEAWNNYKTIRNIHKVKIEQKNRYITNKINNAYNQMEFWC